jgi:uroporphyrinogen decarboxylase
MVRFKQFLIFFNNPKEIQMSVENYRPNPDFNNILAVLRNERPARPTLFEFFMNMPLYQRMAGPLPADCPKELQPLLTTVLAFQNLGYDYATVCMEGFGFEATDNHGKASCSMNEGSAIYDRESFNAYAWPDPDMAVFHQLADIAPFMPAGMKIIVRGSGGIFENVTTLVGYENLCIMIMEDEELAADIFNQVGSRFLRYYENVLKYDTVGTIIYNDDWGFRSQTLLSPDQFRRFVFPWCKKIVAAAHASGRPAILHSCGQLDAIWDDIIDDMKFNAKHSYEDTILSVEESYEKYGKRIAILGGLDLDFVCRSTPEEVYQRAKAIIAQTAKRGGYALGTGNSIPGYVPEENYFAMIRAVQETH